MSANFAFFNPRKINLPATLVFVVALVAIALLMPRPKAFDYQYQAGKLWNYSNLFAPFDFPIHKSEKAILKERDSVLKSFRRYYSIDETQAETQKQLFEAHALQTGLDAATIERIKRQLTEIYTKGIIPISDKDSIQQIPSFKNEFLLKRGQIYEPTNLQNVYTPLTAYEKIKERLLHAIPYMDLDSLSIDNYLVPNLLYNADWSEKALTELLGSVQTVEGMVQTKERIIGYGEKVTDETEMKLNSLKSEIAGHSAEHRLPLLGKLTLITLLLAFFMLYLYFFRIREYASFRRLLFIVLNIAIPPVLMCILLRHELNSAIYIIPFVIPAILLRTFIDSRTALTSYTVMIFICSLLLSAPNSGEFLLLQYPAGFVAVLAMKELTERSQLIRCALLVFLTYIAVYLAMIMWKEGALNKDVFSEYRIAYFGINFVFVMFSYLLVYLCEKSFGFISGVSMIELSNTNKPLLQKLAETAPGTFQHSMQMANLAAAAAQKIGANATLVRTGAMYHDIGKMKNPNYFTENQSNGENPHSLLSPVDSAKIIIGHVKEGEKIARQYNLPPQIIDFILTHHGKGKAKYFYITYCNQHPGEKVDDAPFTYPGPNPKTRETGILMMADAVEAASRSLKEYTEESITKLVDTIIDSQLADRLLNDTPLTFIDIKNIKAVFCEKLKTAYHTRIAYPQLQKEKENQKQKEEKI